MHEKGRGEAEKEQEKVIQCREAVMKAVRADVMKYAGAAAAAVAAATRARAAEREDGW